MAAKGLKSTYHVLFFLFLSQHLFSQPSITSFSPLTGPVGTTVVINGANFNSIAANNIVYFGATKATVSAATANTLTVTVPNGASYSLLSVTTNGLSTYAAMPFIVTFPGGGAITHDSFKNKTSMAAGGSPYDIASGDLDGDGKPDLVVVNGEDPYSISVYRNTSTSGSVSFAAKVDYQTGNGPFSVTVGDIDGDGKQDLVVTNEYSFTVSIFRNTGTPGSISFEAKVDLPALNPDGAAIGDFDRDGKPDLAVKNFVAHKLSIYKNTSVPGTISFAPKTDYATGLYPSGICVGDIDGDKWPDIAVLNSSSENVSIFKNNGAAGAISFSAASGINLEAGVSKVILADLDGDTKPDMGVTNQHSAVVSVFRNISNSGTISFTSRTDYKTATNPLNMAFADIDGDGKPDMAVSCGEDSVSILRNSSVSGAISFDERADVATGQGPYNLTLIDFDGDHMPDVATCNQSENSVSLIQNKVNGPNITSFNPAQASTGTMITITGTNLLGTTAVKLGGVAARSFSIVSATQITAEVGSGATGEISITGPLGTATRKGFTYLHPPKITSFTPTGGSTGTVVTITGSGFTNALEVRFGGTLAQSFTVQSDNTIAAVVGAGSSGSITVKTAVATDASPGFTFTSIGTAPVITSFSPMSGPVGTTVTIAGNHFGASTANNVVYFGAVKATILSATPTTLAVRVPPSATYQPITVTANNLSASSTLPFVVTFEGGPSFTAGSFNTPDSIETMATPSGTCTADLDGDGKPEIMHGYVYMDYITILRNTSSLNAISFAKGVKIVTRDFAWTLAPGDIDGDGKIDLAVANSFNDSWGGGALSILRNTSSPGNISFAPKVEFPSGQGARSITIADLDGDGRPELIVGISSHDYVSVYKNTSTAGNISFAPRLDYPTSDGPVAVKVGDLDGDGKPEIIVANANSGSVSIFHNQSTSGLISFGAKADYASGGYPFSIALGDYDGNGQLDFAVANANSNTISVFRNTSTNNTISLAPKTTLTTPQFPSDIRSSDLNGDGKPDLAAICEGLHGIAIYKNTGSAGTISFAESTVYSKKNLIKTLVVTDFDGDGKDDIAGGANHDYIMYILQNKVGAARTVRSGPNPVTGPVANRVAIDPTVQTHNGRPYVQRHYDIEPDIDPSSATATVTLYFTQQDFDNFNAFAGHGSDLPTNPDDLTNKQNLRVYQYHGVSTTSLPGSYSGSGLQINPDDANITWNSNAACWEVTFDVRGFSGFFVSNTSFTDLASPTLTTTGNTSFCQGGHVMLTSSAASNNQWYKNGVVIEGATAATFEATASGIYSVSVSDNSMTSEPSNSISVTVTSTPAKPDITSDGIQLTSSSPTGNHWFKDGQLIAGAIEQTYKPLEPAHFTVQVAAGGCTSPLSSPVYFVPAPIVSINGDADFCQGGSVTLTASTHSNNQWYKDDIQINGATAKTYQANATGFYTVTTSSNSVTSAPSTGVVVNAKPVPPQPTISVNGSFLESSATMGNQWFKDGVVIPGAIDKLYKPETSANYSVRVTTNGCVSAESIKYPFTITGIIDIDNTHYIKLSPNPADDHVILNHHVAGTAVVTVQIIDINGRIFGTFNNLPDGSKLPVSGLAKGVYIAKIADPKSRKFYMIKLLKR